MRLVFVHGWSVTNTDTYGGLPTALRQHGRAAELDLKVSHLHLAKYFARQPQGPDLPDDV